MFWIPLMDDGENRVVSTLKFEDIKKIEAFWLLAMSYVFCAEDIVENTKLLDTIERVYKLQQEASDATGAPTHVHNSFEDWMNSNASRGERKCPQ